MHGHAAALALMGFATLGPNYIREVERRLDASFGFDRVRSDLSCHQRSKRLHSLR